MPAIDGRFLSTAGTAAECGHRQVAAFKHVSSKPPTLLRCGDGCLCSHSFVLSTVEVDLRDHSYCQYKALDVRLSHKAGCTVLCYCHI